MTTKRCEQCGVTIKKQNKRFCSKKCHDLWRKGKATWNKGSFAKGHRPWNKDLKGIHLSPSSEFTHGQVPINYLPVGVVQIRKRKRGGKKRAWVKVADPNVWRLRAKVVWEEHNGPIPKGLLIHHINRNTLDDHIANLQCLTRAEHLKEHRHEFKKRSCFSRKRHSA